MIPTACHPVIPSAGLVPINANVVMQPLRLAFAADRDRFACCDAFVDKGHVTSHQGSTKNSQWPSVNPPSEAACGRLRVEKAGRRTTHRPWVQGHCRIRIVPHWWSSGRACPCALFNTATASGLGRRIHRGLEYQTLAERIVPATYAPTPCPQPTNPGLRA